MRIKKLEICGFKSFKDRTVIHFDAGITGIVGPNGCGKSNIVDALIWVMGEQSAKHLRGSAMQDVIFSGAEGHPPANMAEVSLTLEDDGGSFPTKYLGQSEIMVTRRLFRSGDSEYMVNRQEARLRDIHEIFMDTGAGSKGFSIIEQGAIGKIITAKPEDRKSLIEEAAGITKFKVRKRESERKLQGTEQNLLRLNDIVNELRRQIESLQRQAKKAERYRSIKERLEDLELWISSKKFLDLKQVADEAQEIYDSLASQQDGRELEIEHLGVRLQELRASQQDIEMQLLQEQQDYDQNKELLNLRERELQTLGFEVEQGRRKEQMTGSLFEELVARQQILQENQLSVEQKHEEVQTRLSQYKEEYETKNSAYQNVHGNILSIENSIIEKRRKVVALQQSESSISAKLQASEIQLDDLRNREQEAIILQDELQSKCKQFEKLAKQAGENLENNRQMQLDIMKDVGSYEENFQLLKNKVQDKQNEISAFKDELNVVTSRLYGLENLHNSFEGFQEGVKNVMMWRRKSLQTHADGSQSEVSDLLPVSEIISVPAEYELAMESALGNRLQMLLSDKSSISLDAVQYLKQNNAGRSSFYAVDGNDSALSNAVPSGNGVLHLLKDLVGAPEKYKAALDNMVGKVAIVDSLTTAIELREQFSDWDFVTMEGDSLNANGILTGGTLESAESGILKRRREIKELSLKKEEWAGKLALAEVSLKKMQAQLESLETDLEKAQKAQNEQEIKIAELRKDNERAETEHKNALNALARQEQECRKLEEQRSQIELKLVDAQNASVELMQTKLSLEAEVEALDLELSSTKNGIDDLQKRVTDLKVLVAEHTREAEGLQNQLNMLNANLNEVNSKLAIMEQETEENRHQLTENQLKLQEEQIALERSKIELQTAAENLAILKERNQNEESELRVIEDQYNSIRTEQTNKIMAMNEAKLKFEQSRMKEQYIEEQIRERYQVELSQVAVNYQDREGDAEDAEFEIDELKANIKRLGEVNLSAITEYDETVKRFEFLSQQQEDLNNAKKELMRVIERINRICSRRFKETFEAVNERFIRSFPVLFGGGEANLTLIEDPESGEMGIDIMARPPGKKLQSVSLLSGGEKALTAVALIFSIFLVKPSPYCLLDEVDAPLDDANVMRFNELVKEMAKRSQIIVVTHNKNTMEINKKLYGVTMQERGVSKMVSVSLNDAARLAVQ